jgi:hypothetical protein
MRMRVCLLMLGLAAFVPGCDSPEHPVAVIALSPPHHGTLISLPDDRGLVELVNEPEVSDRRKPEPTAIVAYFLQLDGKSSLAPAPEEVNFAIQSAGAGGARSKQNAGDRIRLSAEPKADDPLGAGRFASKTGPYALTGLRGTLTATIGGQEISSTFAGSR